MPAFMSALPAWLRRHRATGPAPTDRPLLSEDALQALEQQARQPLAPATPTRETAGARLGEVRSVYRGSGLDYEESRAYQPGDELRFMNWRATARSGEMTMKVFREERRPGVFILVDRRCPMRFGTRRRLKVTQAARAAALLAFRARHRELSLGGLILQTRPQWLPVSRDNHTALRLAAAAAAPCPPCAPARPAPSLAHMLRQLTISLPEGTRLYLISDFHDLDEQDRPLLLALAGHLSLRAIQIHDQGEARLPDAGLLALQDAYGQSTRLLDSADPAVRAQFENQARPLLDRPRDLFHALGLPFLRLAGDDEAIAPALFQD